MKKLILLLLLASIENAISGAISQAVPGPTAGIRPDQFAISEGFEEAGPPPGWFAGAGGGQVNFDYTNVVLDGTQSVWTFSSGIPWGAWTQYVHMPQNELFYSFKIKFLRMPETSCMPFYVMTPNYGTAAMWRVYGNGSCSIGQGYTAADAVVVNVTYLVTAHYSIISSIWEVQWAAIDHPTEIDTSIHLYKKLDTEFEKLRVNTFVWLNAENGSILVGDDFTATAP